jgi:hypothetical protein
MSYQMSVVASAGDDLHRAIIDEVEAGLCRYVDAR